MMPALRGVNLKIRVSNHQNKVSWRILQRIERFSQSLRLRNLGLLVEFSREFNNKYSSEIVQEPSIESVSSLTRYYWQQYEGKTRNLCRFYVSFMSVYETNSNQYHIENKVFTLMSMSDVSIFQKLTIVFIFCHQLG